LYGKIASRHVALTWESGQIDNTNNDYDDDGDDDDNNDNDNNNNNSCFTLLNIV